DEKNPNYWDKDNVKIDHIKLTFYDGSDQESLIRSFTQGAYTTARLFPTSASYTETEKAFKDNIVYTQQDSTTYWVGTNIDRQSYT
ncbi:peptide ABC transporter ATP-binding protein, partial [Streptococcus pneumoniae]|uniref:ABC transporter substrate-binding protein n=1 Tax=Streptococcus pneumoniae TaxID=1313 RepID=UPI0013B5D42E